MLFKKTLVTSAFQILLAVILLTGCSKGAARVGDVVISDQSVDSVTKFKFSPEVGKKGDTGLRCFSLALLIRKELAVQVLKANGVTLDEKRLEAALREMQAVPASKAAFKKISAITGNDRNALLHDFVAMACAEKILATDVYPKQSEKANAGQKALAEAFIRKVAASPQTFVSQASHDSLQLRRVSMNASGIMGTDQDAAMLSPKGSPGFIMLSNVAQKMTAGGVFTKPIETANAFLVLQFKGNDKQGALYDAVFIPKLDYDGWFWKEAAKVPVRIRDREMQVLVMKNAEWGKHLNLKSK